jgi:hypothetical protein
VIGQLGGHSDELHSRVQAVCLRQRASFQTFIDQLASSKSRDTNSPYNPTPVFIDTHTIVNVSHCGVTCLVDGTDRGDLRPVRGLGRQSVNLWGWVISPQDPKRLIPDGMARRKVPEGPKLTTPNPFLKSLLKAIISLSLE